MYYFIHLELHVHFEYTIMHKVALYNPDGPDMASWGPPNTMYIIANNWPSKYTLDTWRRGRHKEYVYII